MPFKSKAQARWAHSKGGQLTLAQVKEWSSKTNVKRLPARARSKHEAKQSALLSTLKGK
jgi:hypothetical protein